MTTFKLEALYYFGKDVVKNNLAHELKNHKIKTILLAYGSGSIKKNGLYQQIIDACKNAKVKVVEHSGIEPNPRDLGIYQAALECRKNKVDLIIAAGGGSVIDACKIIGILATNTQYKNCWSYIMDNSKVTHKSIPLFSINTLAATGSENNDGSVITNAITKYKRSTSTPSANPVVCFEDPLFQLTLSKWQTACGIFDIFSHLMEQYYDPNKQFEWTKQYIVANMLVVIDCAKKLMKNLNDCDARANLLWTSSMALNGLCKIETSGGDWTTHRLEHAISGLWDVEHGAGLALICPTYLKYVNQSNKLFKQYSLEIARQVFGASTLEKYYSELAKFIKLLCLPTKYTDFKQITSVSEEDITWLNKHFNEATKNKENIAKHVFSHIKI